MGCNLRGHLVLQRLSVWEVDVGFYFPDEVHCLLHFLLGDIHLGLIVLYEFHFPFEVHDLLQPSCRYHLLV